MALVDLDVDVIRYVHTRQFHSDHRVVAVLDDLYRSLNPLVAGLDRASAQSAAAGPKMSRSHRSVSHAGRDHKATVFMDDSLLFVVS